jgi:cytochrome c oxidase subunit 2
MRPDGVLQAAGEAARAIQTVSWVLFGGGLVIFTGVMLLLAWAWHRRAGPVRPRLWIVGGGVLFPGAVLAALFVWTLPLSPVWKPVPPPGALVVAVKAHMWWWEVRYRDPATGADVFGANEIRIPAGRPVYLALSSADVIHSFWVPPLAGKMDMVPGRLQHLLLSADRPGTWRGQCAEFCGEQHARMALHVVALEPAAFDAWLAAQARPAAAPASPRQDLGRQAFLANRCDACHAVRGVGAESRLGPDLTHVGSRLQLAAGTVDNTPEGRAQWIAHVQQLKTGARMPSYDRLDAATLGAIAEWLGALQ